MRKWTRGLGLVLLAVAVLTTGCTSSDGVTVSPEVPSIVPVVTQEVQDRVYAKALVEPARSVTLRSSVGGTVVEVPVAEGDLVAAGSVLLRLDSDDADVAVARAAAGLAEAEAQLALALAGTRSEHIALAQAQLDVADAGVARAAAQRDTVTAGLVEADALEAQAQLLDAQLVHEQADSAHDDTMKCYDVTLPDGSGRKVCPTLGTLEEMSRAHMEAAYAGLVAAQARLDVAQKRLEPEAAAARAGVQTAVASRDAVAAQLDLALAGARREEVGVAQAGVAQAKVSLAQARELLSFARIEVPFDATLTDLPVEPGDTLTQGSPVATLAALDRLQLRTTDLTELDVVDVVVGQPVFATFDAVAAQQLRGTVTQVEPQGRSQFGEVIYDVIIVLDASPEWMRWGMTAQVDIATGGEASTEALNAASPEIVATTGTASPGVLAEAVVRPWRSSVLHFATSGEISEVLVGVGDAVRAGDLLVVADSGNQVLAVAAAEAAVATARAELALAESGPRAADVAGAEAGLAAARAGLSQAIALRDQLSSGVAEAESAGVQAQLDGALAKRRQLEAALHWAEDDGDDERASDVRDQLYANDAAVTALQARLEALPVSAAARLREANAGVAAAQGQVGAAQASLDLVLAGPTTESISLFEVAVEQAEVSLAAAQIALSRTELHAAFDGVVTQVYVEVGDSVSPERPVLELADLTDLQVETTDLREMDVVRIYEGQSVRVTIDALPGETWQGHVLRVKRQNLMLGGDAVYPALIQLDGPHPGLRWGMSAAVTFLSD